MEIKIAPRRKPELRQNDNVQFAHGRESVRRELAWRHRGKEKGVSKARRAQSSRTFPGSILFLPYTQEEVVSRDYLMSGEHAQF